jgi:hypothetical protein
VDHRAQGRRAGRQRRRTEDHAAPPGAEFRRHDAARRPDAAVAHRAGVTVKALADTGEVDVQLFAEAVVE